MASPNHPSQSDHGVHGTTLAPTSDGLGAVDVNLSLSLSLNSSSTLPSHQNQTNPVIDQLSSHHHLDGARARRSNLNIPFGLHAHSSSDYYPIQPQNNVNLNIFMGNNSSLNINLLNNNPISQFASNSPAGSSSTPPIINIFNPASSHVQQPFLNLSPNQEPILNRYSETNGSPRFARLHSQYASPVVAAGSGNTRGTYATNSKQEIPTAISYLRQNIVSLSTHQGQPSNLCQRILDQSRTISQHTMGLSLFNQPFRYRGEKYNHVPSLPSSILNSPNHQIPILIDENGTLHLNSSHPQPNPTFPEIHPASEEVAEQASEPNNNATTEPASQARRTSMYRSHPYKKYGPYTCPKCHVVFENGYRYSAHTQIHYKDETPDERKKRRESKIRKRDMHLANSADGITVMPGSLQQREEPISMTGSGQPICVIGSATMIIKKEVD